MTCGGDEMPSNMKKIDKVLSGLINRSLVLSLIARTPLISRAQLAGLIDVKKSTITRILNVLLEEDLVREIRKGPAGALGGRRPIQLQINPLARTVIALDIRIQHIIVAISNLCGEILFRAERPIESEQPPIAQLRAALIQARSDRPDLFHPAAIIGISTPGIVDAADGVLILSMSHGWKNQEIAASLKGEFQRPVFLENDANAAAAGEMQNLEKSGVRSLIYLLIREARPRSKYPLGVGGAILLDGRIWRGARAYAGEVSKAVNDRIYSRMEHFDLKHSLPDSNGALRMDAIVTAMESGDRQAEAFFYEMADIVGSVLCEMAAFLDPNAVVLSVLFSRAGDEFAQAARESFERHRGRLVDSPAEFFPALEKDDAPLRGIIAMALRRIFVADSQSCSLLFQ